MGVYMILYLIVFRALETRRTAIHIIRASVDAQIPFCEYFVVPYLLWFVYMVGMVVFFCLREPEEGRRLSLALIFGMSVFLFVSAVWPNGLLLRPAVMPRDNVFTRLVQLVYAADTSTNVTPSIHVYNTLAVMISLVYSRVMREHRLLRAGLFLCGVSIILSTMFIKQHSVLDVMWAFALAMPAYAMFYSLDPLPLRSG
ncbi:MAG: serine/threonine protein phosphatase, partial [Oscillospiraceae bacterium]|nr:serine/threonine protein phosphatase [Oscillospiraceae bacterium]